ncbi:MAG TPA: acyl-CoA dehydrogenase [Streptosporangiaceae bacterium]|jgi:alkylation response protein AidB-like acyl-CoA dehydrogenase|nr:acyl-CoA dehydrogenase [Streptosporangiaceae bacterium]
MALPVTEEHQALAESVRGWAERNAGPQVLRAAVGAPDGGSAHYLQTLHPGLAAQGLLGLHLPEGQGGQGFGLAELAVAVAELGRGLMPGGYLPTVLASAVLAAAGADGKLVTSLADGTRCGAVSLAAGITAAAAGGGAAGSLVLTGNSAPVLGGSLADLVVLPVAAESGEIWVAVDATEIDVTPLDSLDLTRPVARLDAGGVVVPAERVLAGLDRRTVTGLAAVLLGAEAAGMAGWAVTTAAEYAKIRHQFGRPIGQFQAVKHRCARMLTQAEQADAVVWDTARALDRADGPAGRALDAPAAQEAAAQAEFTAAVAATVAVDAAVECAHECIQVLGGIGYTWEHEAHLYYRRALSLRALLGPSGRWARHAAALATAGVRRKLEIELPDEAEAWRTEIRAELAEIAALSWAEQIEPFAAGGWVAPHLPKPWGRGATPLEQVIIAQELRAAKLRPPVLFIGAWAMSALVGYGTPEQRERFLPRTLRNQLTWCQLFSEPGAGSDLAGISTRAERADGGWRITGQKIWTSLARQAEWAICIARTNPAEPRHDGISYFLVDMSSPGIEVRPLREMTGDELFNQVFLDDVFVPDDCVVGEINGGWKVARSTLANERVSLSQSWTSGFGVAELLASVAKHSAAQHSTARQSAAQPDPGLAEEGEQVGRLVCGGHALDVLGLRVTLRQLSGTEPGATASVRKLLGMRHAQQVSECCWSLSGPDGALGPGREAGWRPGDGQDDQARQWSKQVLLSRALTIGGGTTDIQLNIIAERILGLPRDPEPPAA